MISTKNYYQTISLLNIVGKIIKVVPKAKINYMAITHNLLLKTYFKSEHIFYVKTTIYYLQEKIYIVWNKNKIAYFYNGGFYGLF